MRARFVVAVLAVLPSPLSAQTPPWATTGPLGGRIRNIAVTSSGTIFLPGEAMTPHQGLPNSWSPIAESQHLPSNTRDFATTAASPLFMYAANAEQGWLTGGVFRSVDGGGKWEEATSGLPVGKGKDYRAAAIDPVNSMNGLVGNGFSSPPKNGIYRTTDGGLTWFQTLSSVQVTSIAYDPSNPSIAFAATSVGTQRSVTGGATWTLVDGGSPTTQVVVHPNGQEVYAVSGGDVRKSTNGGNSWSGSSPGGTSYILRSIDLFPTTPTTLFASGFVITSPPPPLGLGDGVLFRSTDAGANWWLVETAPNVPFTIVHNPFESVAFDPSNVNTLYVGVDTGGIYRTQNALATPPTFAAVNSGLIGTEIRELASQWQGPAANKVFAGLDSRTVGYRDPMTGNWTAYDVPNTLAGCGWSAINAIGFDARTSPTALGGTVYVGDCFKVQRSIDDGQNWTPSMTTIGGLITEVAVAHDIAMGQLFATVLVGTSTAGVWRSDDGGVSFMSVGGPQGVENFTFVYNYGLGFLKVLAAVPGPSAGGGFWYSTNDGNAGSWIGPSNAGLPANDLTIVADGDGGGITLYAGAGSGNLPGVYKSTNGGANWLLTQPLTGLQRNVFGLTVGGTGALPRPVFASTRGGVLRSGDSGASWMGFSRGLINTRCGPLRFSVGTGGPLLNVGTEGRGVYQVVPQ